MVLGEKCNSVSISILPSNSMAIGFDVVIEVILDTGYLMLDKRQS